ncbi:MAG: hypothetical protein M3304_12990 [Actinomycetota bacterium]|nr:hypothetical protein [Actinomycetota bacterium]
MPRCEGYYRLESRRCDRDAAHEAWSAEGQAYLVCGYHGRHASGTSVARWHGDSGIRTSVPTALRLAPPSQALGLT